MVMRRSAWLLMRRTHNWPTVLKAPRLIVEQLKEFDAPLSLEVNNTLIRELNLPTQAKASFRINDFYGLFTFKVIPCHWGKGNKGSGGGRKYIQRHVSKFARKHRLLSPCLKIRTLCENNKERRYCFYAKILKYFVPYSVVSKENTDSLSHTQTNDKQMNSVVKFIE